MFLFWVLQYGIFISGGVLASESPKIAKFNSFHQQRISSLFMLTCNVVQGNEPFKFQWLKNNVELNSDSSRHKINTQNTFSVFSLIQIEPSDSGNYSCAVGNDYGFDVQWSVLEVKGLDSFLEFCLFSIENFGQNVALST